MGLTSEVDVKLLHQCFELDSFDNLLKPEFMNAVRQRREALLDETRKKAEENRLKQLQYLKEETMKCNIISQRIQLQEYLLVEESTITKKIEETLQDEEGVKLIDRAGAEGMFDGWLSGYNHALTQPTEYFRKHPTNDYELVCNALS